MTYVSNHCPPLNLNQNGQLRNHDQIVLAKKFFQDVRYPEFKNQGVMQFSESWINTWRSNDFVNENKFIETLIFKLPLDVAMRLIYRKPEVVDELLSYLKNYEPTQEDVLLRKKWNENLRPNTVSNNLSNGKKENVEKFVGANFRISSATPKENNSSAKPKGNISSAGIQKEENTSSSCGKIILDAITENLKDGGPKVLNIESVKKNSNLKRKVPEDPLTEFQSTRYSATNGETITEYVSWWHRILTSKGLIQEKNFVKSVIPKFPIPIFEHMLNVKPFPETYAGLMKELEKCNIGKEVLWFGKFPAYDDSDSSDDNNSKTEANLAHCSGSQYRSYRGKRNSSYSKPNYQERLGH